MIKLTPTADNQYDIISDVDYKKLISKSEQLMDNGEVEAACQARFDAAEKLLEAIYSDDESIEINMQNIDNQPFIEILYLSGSDHYYIGDFDMGAAFAEQVLELDPEDHFGATTIAALCYAGLTEWESLQESLESQALSPLIERFLTTFMHISQGGSDNIDNEIKTELNNAESKLSHILRPIENAFSNIFEKFKN